jgi:inhibitor of KinA
MPEEHKSYIIYPLGETALTLDFGNVIDAEINKWVLALFKKLQTLALPFLLDIVPAYASLTIYYDVVQVQPLLHDNQTAAHAMQALLENMVASLETESNGAPRAVRIPVCYSNTYAPDLKALACTKGMKTEDVIALHIGQTYRVYMIGFMPGFPYMGEVNEKIAMTRKEQPRLRVEAGSVGIAGRQTGIYPLATPGGWQIIGRTPVQLFDPSQPEPTMLRPGDEVQFYSITEDEFESYKGRTA